MIYTVYINSLKIDSTATGDHFFNNEDAIDWNSLGSQGYCLTFMFVKTDFMAIEVLHKTDNTNSISQLSSPRQCAGMHSKYFINHRK